VRRVPHFTVRFDCPVRAIVRASLAVTCCRRCSVDAPSSWPDAERTTNSDKLADVVGRVVGGKQDGTQVRLR